MTVDPAEDGETVLFKTKPNAFLYALEATRFGFVMLAFVFAYIPLGYFKGWPLRLTTLTMLVSYCAGNIVLLLLTAVVAYHLVFLVTDRKVIVRFSFWGKTIDRISIAINSVSRIETNSYAATYGSVYLKSVKPPSRKNSKDGEPETLPSTIPSVPGELGGVAIPIKRTGSIWRSMPLSSPPLYGFYGFKRFDAFASLISEQQRHC